MFVCGPIVLGPSRLSCEAAPTRMRCRLPYPVGYSADVMLLPSSAAAFQ
jgi:hypothetical protein